MPAGAADADTSFVPDYRSLLSLDGRGYAVLGAGQGNGRQTAHALASVGGHVLCIDVDAVLAEQVAAEVGGQPCTADVTKTADVERVVATAVRAFGRLDGVVDIVGMARWAALVDMPEADWDWCFAMNLRHGFLVTKIAGRAMADGGEGSLVFISSESGVRGAPFHGAYGAAKAGLLSLVQTAALEMAAANVRVNAVVPGAIATPRMARSQGLSVEELTDGSLRRPARTSDIAAAALFLTSDLARHITGVALPVDGGDLAQHPHPLDAAPWPPGTSMGLEQQPVADEESVADG